LANINKLAKSTACEMLVKLTIDVNFTDTLQAAFAPIYKPKLQAQKKLLKTLLYKNAARKMLFKLTTCRKSGNEL